MANWLEDLPVWAKLAGGLGIVIVPAGVKLILGNKTLDIDREKDFLEKTLKRIADLEAQAQDTAVRMDALREAHATEQAASNRRISQLELQNQALRARVEELEKQSG